AEVPSRTNEPVSTRIPSRERLVEPDFLGVSGLTPGSFIWQRRTAESVALIGGRSFQLITPRIPSAWFFWFPPIDRKVGNQTVSSFEDARDDAAPQLLWI